MQREIRRGKRRVQDNGRRRERMVDGRRILFRVEKSVGGCDAHGGCPVGGYERGGASQGFTNGEAKPRCGFSICGCGVAREWTHFAAISRRGKRKYVPSGGCGRWALTLTYREKGQPLHDVFW